MKKSQKKAKRSALAMLFQGLAENVASAFDAAAATREDQPKSPPADHSMSGVKPSGCGGCK